MSRKDLALIGVAALCLIAWVAVRSLPYGVLLSLIGVLLGAAISAGLSWYFYRQSSEDLRNEAERLRRYNDALLSYLAAAGVIPPRCIEIKQEIPSRRCSSKCRVLISRLEARPPRSRAGRTSRLKARGKKGTSLGEAYARRRISIHPCSKVHGLP